MSGLDGTREPAIVDYVRDDDERCTTHFVGFKGPTGGWGQGMGGIVMTAEALEDWKASIAALFGVRTIEETVGRNCFILRSWPGWGSNIEGIEVDGRRFTVTGFTRKHWPEKAKSALEAKEESIRCSIYSNASRIQDLSLELTRVRKNYVEWESPSESDPR